MDVRRTAALSLPLIKPRKPTRENEIAASIYRPHVAAVDRILLWTTPHSLIAQHRRDAEVSPRLQVMMFKDLLHSTEHDTRQAYGAGLLRYNQFCDREGIPEGRRMPASDILLGAFISDHSGQLSGKGIRNWLNGLRLWHIYNDAEWHGKDGWLPGIVKAADKKGVPFKRPPRGPVTLDHLRELRRHLDLTKPRDAAIWAAALAAFWGCRRLGELLIKSLAKFSTVHHVTRSTRFSRRLVNILAARLYVRFHLPWTKTTGILGGDTIFTATGDEFCPVWALDNHLAINHSPDRDTPMFSFRDGSGWSPLLKHQFLNFSSNIFESENLEKVFGHSYRIGGSLKLLLDGVAPEVVMKVGGWTSLRFLIYWRRLEEVIPLAITRAWDAQIRAFAAAHGIQHDVVNINLD
ncbi:DNA breaking-rejoining enzyme [Mycena polygramma]|nr:DNA breaking-rejoining enzyme [Mycena polygramma]